MSAPPALLDPGPRQRRVYLLSGPVLVRAFVGERPAEALCELARLGPGPAGGRHEDGGPVVAELLDALPDVGESPMVAALHRRVEVRPGVPAPAELLDRGDVDDPVVQVGVECSHVAGQEGAVGADAVAGQRRAGAFGALRLDVP